MKCCEGSWCTDACSLATIEQGFVKEAFCDAQRSMYLRTHEQGFVKQAALEAQGLTMEVHVYEGANHGFSVADSSNWQQAGADTAWPRTVTFFCKALGVAVPDKMPAPPEQQHPSKASSECTSGCAAMAEK